MPIKIKRGLDIPLAGTPEPAIGRSNPVSTVALLGLDTPGLKPRMSVAVGDRVKLGQPLFVDKRQPDVPYTSPGAGVVKDIHRGARRVLLSVVIELDGDESETFPQIEPDRIASIDDQELQKILVASGAWTSFRTRPFSHVPAPDTRPHSMFVTAIDTNPHAPDPAQIIAEQQEAFSMGATAVARLSEGQTFVCTAAGASIEVPGACERAEFSGPHPAGLPGTHIHFIDPVSENKTCWHIGYQDVIAIGQLLLTGRPFTERVISMSGPMIEKPRLIRTRAGASLKDLLEGEVKLGDVRVVSGSVLSGHRGVGGVDWLGRYHRQVTVIEESRDRELLHWMRPGVGKYSSLRAFVGHLFSRKPFELTASQNGSPRAMVPIGAFERVMPLDILPTMLLKSILVRDTEGAKGLGALELDEEDLALCTFVCNGKYDYGPHLRQTLDEIEAGH
ncbi:MAG: Na(+)-translocating NADH-quinone reductase subunit A [Woeseiaceae bacterium]|nr:Na(+)-translocating NADH-quinone reductase subunit A [Woeseiaceae bacterium]